MEQWKLPELRQSVGYQLQVPGGNPLQQSTGLTHAPMPTTTPTSASRTESVPSLASFSSRLGRVKKNHRIIRSRLRARLDKQDRKNRALAARFAELQEYEKYVVDLQELEKYIETAESFGKSLETKVQFCESVVNKYNLEGPRRFGEGLDEEEDNEDESKEDKDEEVEDDGGSEGKEVDATDSSEEESVVEEDSESNCSDDEDDN